jgi:hypothetical protein
MKVYLTSSKFSFEDLTGVFSSRQKAEEYVMNHPEDFGASPVMDEIVYEAELDKPFDEAGS